MPGYDSAYAPFKKIGKLNYYLFLAPCTLNALDMAASVRNSRSPSTLVNNAQNEESAGKEDIGEAEPKRDILSDVDGGYGWVVVFASFLITFSTWGLNSAYGIYFTYYVDTDRFPNARPFDYATIGGISFGVGVFFSPVINYVQGKIGTRPTILLGNVCQFSAGILASFSTELWQLYLTQGLLQSFGLAIISLSAMTIIPQWFEKKRVLANLIVTTGSGAGGIVFNLGLQKIIEVKNVEWALRTQAIISCVLVLIACVFIRTKSKHHKVEFTAYDKECVHNTGFWILSFYLAMTMFGYVVVMYSLADFTVSLGYTARQGSIAGAMLQVGFCIGRPLAGYLSDFLGPLTIAACAYLLAAIFVLGMWIPCRNYATILMFAILEGMFSGTVFPTSAPITARLVGISKLNVAFCMLWMFLALSSLFSNMIGNSLTSGSGLEQYRNTAIFAGVSFFAAAASMTLLRGISLVEI